MWGRLRIGYLDFLPLGVLVVTGPPQGTSMAKRAISMTQNVSQLVATTVVASFTEHTVHLHLNSLVPMMMINWNYRPVHV